METIIPDKPIKSTDTPSFLKEVIKFEAAQEEINDWLDHRKVMPLQRESYKDHIDILIESMQYGLLTLNDNCFKQKLHFPTGDTKELNYKERVTSLTLAPKLKGVKAGEADDRVLAYFAALTDEPKQILKNLDPADTRIANSIVVFFVS